MIENIILFDDDNWTGLLPLTYTRPICDIRCGILTIREKWDHYFDLPTSYITQPYLSEKYPLKIKEDNLIVNSTVLPTPELIDLIKELNQNEAIIEGDELIAARITIDQFDSLINSDDANELDGIDLESRGVKIKQITRPHHIFEYNDEEIRKDFELLTNGRTSQPLSSTNRIAGTEHIFVEEGATVEFATLNATTGPIYIGKDAVVMEGALVRGPLAMCNNAVVKMGAKIYGATTLGPHCKAGGEIGNSVMIGYSNKGHEGYLGNSVLGEWCNLGADTNTSNLKNNYANVKLWSYDDERFMDTGLQFCGLIMGDHSKTGINTMFNTGTVVGVNCNIFGSGYPRNFIPSYSWGGASGFRTFLPRKANEVAEKVMLRRKVDLTDQDRDILQSIYEHTGVYRPWEQSDKT